VDFPIKNGDFPSFFVCLPEGTWFSGHISALQLWHATRHDTWVQGACYTPAPRRLGQQRYVKLRPERIRKIQALGTRYPAWSFNGILMGYSWDIHGIYPLIMTNSLRTWKWPNRNSGWLPSRIAWWCSVVFCLYVYQRVRPRTSTKARWAEVNMTRCGHMTKYDQSWIVGFLKCGFQLSIHR